MSEYLFWGSILFIFYSYFGYPMVLTLLSGFRKRPVRKGSIFPQVSFIIAAHNEETRILKKIENTANQDYPQDKMEIIVASDFSGDRTDEIVKSFSARNIKLIRSPRRVGKEAVQKLALDNSSGEILVFSDVATMLEPSGVANIVSNFADPCVGCVSSVDKFISSNGKASGEGMYVKYEMLLRRMETRIGTLVSLSGSFFAARREVCREWAADRQSDFNTLMNSVKMGLRGVLDPDSAGYYQDIADEKKEYGRKVRTVLRGISVFMKSLPLLNFFKYGLFSWQLISHKLCRWLVPLGLLLVFISNALLVPAPAFYQCLFILQIVFYALAISGILSRRFAAKRAFKIPSFFVMTNFSILHAWFLYLRGSRLVSWEPSKR